MPKAVVTSILVFFNMAQKSHKKFGLLLKKMSPRPGKILSKSGHTALMNRGTSPSLSNITTMMVKLTINLLFSNQIWIINDVCSSEHLGIYVISDEIWDKKKERLNLNGDEINVRTKEIN